MEKTVLKRGDITFDLETGKATYKGKTIPFRKKSRGYRILKMLFENKAVSYRDIILTISSHPGTRL